MTDLAVIILIGQEKIHLKRCVEKLAALNPRQIFLVEPQPDDGGVAKVRLWLPARSSRRMSSRGPSLAAIRRNSSRSAS